MDILIYSLITDTQYKLPLLAPNGSYCPSSTSTTEIRKTSKLIQITDVLGRETKQINQPLLYLYDDGTVEKKIFID